MRGTAAAVIAAAVFSAFLPASSRAEEEVVLEGPVVHETCGMWPLMAVAAISTGSRTYALIDANRDGKQDLSDTVWVTNAFLHTCSRLQVRGTPGVLACGDAIEGGGLEGIRVEEIVVLDRPACGDVDDSGGVDLTDGIRILQDLFQKDQRFLCQGVGDVDGNGKVDITDAIHLFWYLFAGGPDLRCD